MNSYNYPQIQQRKGLVIKIIKMAMYPQLEIIIINSQIIFYLNKF